MKERSPGTQPRGGKFSQVLSGLQPVERLGRERQSCSQVLIFFLAGATAALCLDIYTVTVLKKNKKWRHFGLNNDDFCSLYF